MSALPRRAPQRRPRAAAAHRTVDVRGADVRAARHEQVHHVAVAPERGARQCRTPALPVHAVDGRAGVHQVRHHGAVATTGGGRQERRPGRGVRTVDVCGGVAAIDPRRHLEEIARRRREEEGRGRGGHDPFSLLQRFHHGGRARRHVRPPPRPSSPPVVEIRRRFCAVDDSERARTCRVSSRRCDRSIDPKSVCVNHDASQADTWRSGFPRCETRAVPDDCWFQGRDHRRHRHAHLQRRQQCPEKNTQSLGSPGPTRNGRVPC